MKPVFNTQFQAKFHSAMHTLIILPSSQELLARFRHAYEYRRQYPWLKESSDQCAGEGSTGLATALQAALATYIVHVPTTEPSAQGISDTQPPDVKSGGDDRVWIEAIKAATQATIEESFHLERFEKRLVRRGIDVDAMTLGELQGHIAAAIESYSHQRMVGLSPDPF